MFWKVNTAAMNCLTVVCQFFFSYKWIIDITGYGASFSLKVSVMTLKTTYKGHPVNKRL